MGLSTELMFISTVMQSGSSQWGGGRGEADSTETKVTVPGVFGLEDSEDWEEEKGQRL